MQLIIIKRFNLFSKLLQYNLFSKLIIYIYRAPTEQIPTAQSVSTLLNKKKNLTY